MIPRVLRLAALPARGRPGSLLLRNSGLDSVRSCAVHGARSDTISSHFVRGLSSCCSKSSAPGRQRISKWVYRHFSQSVCPWNVKFSRDATEVTFAAREIVADKDARTLAVEILAMSQEEFTAAFRKSPMKRAKLAGLQRNARVVLGRPGRADADAP